LFSVNLTGGQTGDGEGIGVAVFLTTFFFGFFTTGFLLVVAFLVAVAFLVGVAFLVATALAVGLAVALTDALGEGLLVGVAACTLDIEKLVATEIANKIAITLFCFTLHSI
jgi:hypothetical protein